MGIDESRSVLVNLGVVLFILFFLSGFVSADANSSLHERKVYFFWGVGCSHCENVEKSGILEEISEIEGVSLHRLEVYGNQTNREKYNSLAKELEIESYNLGVPFLVVECSEGYSYLIGDTPIINHLKEIIDRCEPMKVTNPQRTSSGDPLANSLTLGSIIFAAFVDSINPCAFGVLIFLLATMLSMASAKRALKYGLLYIFIIFLVYFSVGLGIVKIMNEFSSVMNYFVLFAGILVFIGGLIEIKDFFWYGKGFSLKIPDRVKPALEGITQKGTLSAIIFLGIIVALVELPCTGGIYLAILSMMHINQMFGISYLLLYNFIFVLPLIAMVIGVYYGARMESITLWVEGNKKWMRLVAGIVMVGLAIYLLNSVYSWV